MKINRFGKAEVLTPQQVNVLFTEGFVNPRDRALFGVCLYAAYRINEAGILLTGDEGKSLLCRLERHELEEWLEDYSLGEL